jgi:hypothetical protein
VFRSPSLAGLPHIQIMIDDIPTDKKQIARHLGITLRSLNRYIRAEGAPRAIMLALFWETKWGRSAADTEAANYGAIYYRKAMGLERTNQKLRQQIVTLETELTNSNYSAANSPFFQIG